MKTEASKEHQWLKQFVGEWTYVSEIPAGEGEEPHKFTGTETIRAIGDLWIQTEGRGEMPGGEVAIMMMTLGYDPQKKKYVGSWLGTMMSYFWVYEGHVDASGNVLVLDTIGPDCRTEEPTAGYQKYQERIEFTADGNRVFTSHLISDDGTPTELSRVVYTRKK